MKNIPLKLASNMVELVLFLSKKITDSLEKSHHSLLNMQIKNLS